MSNIDSLNSDFGIDRRIGISLGSGELPWARLRFCDALVDICLQGAHITSYQTSPGKEVLWKSSKTNYGKSNAIRGGIPLCWPWFGRLDASPNRPQHGYARNSMFTITSSKADETQTAITLSLSPETAPFPEWTGILQLEMEVRLSSELWIEMRTRNLTDDPISFSSALHSYFDVSDVSQIQIPQLQHCYYLDKLQNYEKAKQTLPFLVESEVDRVYKGVSDNVNLIDPLASRRLDIKNWGCQNLVIWNPWKYQAERMADFDDDGYLNMMCIEPANATGSSVTLLPRQEHRLGQRIKMSDTA